MSYIYLQEINCQRCGYKFAGYAARTSPDHAGVGCPSCGQNIYIPLQPGVQYNEYPDVQQTRTSTYTDLYQQQEQEARLSPRHLLKVLVKPVESFKELWPITDMRMGIMLIVVLSVLNSIISYIAYEVSGMSEWSTGYGGSLPMSYFTLLVGIPMAILSAVAVGWLSAKMAGSMGGRANIRKTIGFMGYAAMPGLVFGIITSAIIISGFVEMPEMPDTNDPDFDQLEYDYGPLLRYALVMGAIAIIGLIWALIVAGAGISVANDVSHLKGMGAYFISWIIMAMVVGGVSAVIALAAMWL